MRYALAFFILLLATLSTQAATDQYGRTLTCTGAGPVVCVTGSLSVTANTEAQAVTTFNGMAPPSYVPPPSPPTTTIPAYDFINRLTAAEQTAFMAAKPMWGVQIAALGTVDVTNPALIADVNAAVAGGLLTQARATQLLNLSVASP